MFHVEHLPRDHDPVRRGSRSPPSLPCPAAEEPWLSRDDAGRVVVTAGNGRLTARPTAPLPRERPLSHPAPFPPVRLAPRSPAARRLSPPSDGDRASRARPPCT